MNFFTMKFVFSYKSRFFKIKFNFLIFFFKLSPFY